MLDEKTGYQVSITGMSHGTHEGNGYMAWLSTAINDFDIASPLDFLMITPDSPIHICIQALGCANTAAVIQIYEDTGVLAQFNVAGGTAYIPRNKNRNSAKTSVVTLTHTPVVTAATGDALIQERHAGKSGAHLAYEIILRANTAYLFRFLSMDNDNEGSLNLDWVEFAERVPSGFAGVIPPNI